jgi:type I restriction enzyme S subunit
MLIKMMTAEELKNSILQLALQGKLVEQKSTDEPAQKLLERIRKEKKVQIKSGRSPKDKKMNDVTEEEQLFELPENWVWTRMGELFQHNTGKALNGSNKDGKLLTYITTSNLYWNHFELDNLRSMPFTDSELEKCTATKGDLLVCEGGDFGRAAIWNFDYDIRIQNHIHRLRAYIPMCTKYFYFVINFLKTTGLMKGKGITIKGLSSHALHNLVVPLPPLEEQKRIVAKIEELMPFVDQYAASSEKLNTLNATFPDQMKKSILQEAVQGKLVPQDPSDEPACVLLEKIAEEKKKLIKEGKIKKQKKLPPITEDEIPFEIPESWEWVRLNTVANKIVDGTHHSPVNTEHGEYKYITAKNIKDNGVVLDNVTYVSKDIHDEIFARCNPEKGDVLLIKDGATTGVVTVNNLNEPFSMLSSVALIKCPAGIDPWYVVSVLRSDLFYRNIRHQMKGTGITRITLKQIEPMLIPIPPINEQRRIVDKLQSVLDDVEKFGQ